MLIARTSLNFTDLTKADQLPPVLHIKNTPPRKAYLLGGVFVLVVSEPESAPLLSGFLQGVFVSCHEGYDCCANVLVYTT